MIKINGYEDSSAFVEEYLQDKILKIEKNLITFFSCTFELPIV